MAQQDRPVNSLDRLLTELLKATLERRVVWQREGEGRQGVSLHRSSGYVRIYPVDWDGRAPYALELGDGDGEMVEYVVTETFQTASGDWEFDPQSTRVVQLYHAAKDNSISAVVDGLLDDI